MYSYGPWVPSPDIASASRVHSSAELNDLIKIFQLEILVIQQDLVILILFKGKDIFKEIMETLGIQLGAELSSSSSFCTSHLNTAIALIDRNLAEIKY
jgi:hypothetical protein